MTTLAGGYTSANLGVNDARIAGINQGTFKDSSTPTSPDGTPVTAQALNDILGEMVDLIFIGGGITPQAGVLQLRQAITNIIASQGFVSKAGDEMSANLTFANGASPVWSGGLGLNNRLEKDLMDDARRLQFKNCKRIVYPGNTAAANVPYFAIGGSAWLIDEQTDGINTILYAVPSPIEHSRSGKYEKWCCSRNGNTGLWTDWELLNVVVSSPIDVSGSRALGVTYTNNTGRTLLLCISVNMIYASAFVTVINDGLAQFYNSFVGQGTQYTILVSPDDEYSINGGCVVTAWTEQTL
jgi:hypothetical protein